MIARDAYLTAWREIELCPSLGREHLNPVIEYVRELEAKERVMDRAYLDVIAERDALRARLARLEHERNAIAFMRDALEGVT